jgi:hypothetical protein
MHGPRDRGQPVASRRLERIVLRHRTGASPQRHNLREQQMPKTATIPWQKDVDAALEQARKTNRPLFLDFSAAPA